MSCLLNEVVSDFHAKGVFNNEIVDINLRNYSDKYVVLLFYPLDFTFVCPTELLAFSDRNDEFEKLNCQIFGVSVDSEYSHLAWTNMERKDGGVKGLKFPLLSDTNRYLSKKFNVLSDAGIAYRGMFILDSDSDYHCVKVAHVNDMPIGRNVDEVLRLVQALQFHEKHGEVCPANWKPGKDSIKPTPAESKEYFNKNN